MYERNKIGMERGMRGTIQRGFGIFPLVAQVNPVRPD
jgi:hypothetical protein